jgi:ketosteroid isomerase-like protein
MQEQQNTRVIEEAFAAFGRGDVPAILDRLDDGVIWKGVYGAGPHVPTSGERRGKSQVADFFRQVSESIRFSRFDPQQLIAGGDKVVALGHYTGDVVGGGSIDSDFVMVFTMRSGKVIGFQEFTDSAAVNASYPAAV